MAETTSSAPAASISRRDALLAATSLAALSLWAAGAAEALGKEERPAARLTAAEAPAPHWEAKVDAAVEKMLQQDDAPGTAIGIVRAGKVILARGYGRKRLPDGGKPDENTVFYMGSLSKGITAVGVMLLVENGRVDLDAPASQYIKNLPASWQKITVKQFMTHTSGIPQISRKEKAGQQDIAGVYQAIAATPPAAPPGAKYEYNNFNFAVAGHLIEVISGKTYMDFMTQRIFKPLEMNLSGIGNLSPGNRATGYDRNEAGKLKETEADVLPLGVPSGGLETCVADMLKFNAALVGGTLLKPHAFKKMITPYEGFNATPGWFVRKAGPVTIVDKDGATGGFSSLYSFVPERNCAVIILRNVQGHGVSLAPLTNEIFDSACGLPVAPKNGKNR